MGGKGSGVGSGGARPGAGRKPSKVANAIKAHVIPQPDAARVNQARKAITGELMPDSSSAPPPAPYVPAIPRDRRTPVAIMLEAMHEAYERGDVRVAVGYAILAAPYTSPKLAAVATVTQNADKPKVVTDEPLTDDEWRREFGSLAAPAGPPARTG